MFALNKSTVLSWVRHIRSPYLVFPSPLQTARKVSVVRSLGRRQTGAALLSAPAATHEMSCDE